MPMTEQGSKHETNKSTTITICRQEIRATRLSFGRQKHDHPTHLFRLLMFRAKFSWKQTQAVEKGSFAPDKSLHRPPAILPLPKPCCVQRNPRRLQGVRRPDSRMNISCLKNGRKPGKIQNRKKVICLNKSIPFEAILPACSYPQCSFDWPLRQPVCVYKQVCKCKQTLDNEVFSLHECNQQNARK